MGSPDAKIFYRKPQIVPDCKLLLNVKHLVLIIMLHILISLGLLHDVVDGVVMLDVHDEVLLAMTKENDYQLQLFVDNSHYHVNHCNS